MTPERWAAIEELFHRAAESDPASREALLDNACVNDPTLRKEIEALLARDGGAAAAAVEASVRTELHNLVFPLTGKTVSHYQILNGLGGGGMGLVYRAQDVRLSRRVALKFLPEDSAKDPDALRRFEREARSVSALEHPNICPIYEFGEHEGKSFIVMQLLKGQTVEQFIRAQGAPKGTQPIRRLFDLASQVLKGLEAAHEHGIIHRDIKPGNIFLTTDGQVKILDFGVAKLTHAEIEELSDQHPHDAADATTSVKTIDLTLSRTGAVFGTAAYMSPEQVRGDPLDARTDLFSFGLVLYEMTVGQRAFPGETGPAVQAAILNQTPVPVRDLNPQAPAKLESIINKLLQKDREVRYQTASEVRADVEALKAAMGRRRSRWWAVAAGVTALFMVAAIWLFERQSKAPPAAPNIRMRQLTTNSSENPVSGGAISPDGNYLAYSDTRGLHLKLVDTGETRTVPQPEELKNQSVKWEVGSWFPDSTKLLVNVHASIDEWNEWNSVNTSVWAVSVLGEAPTKLRDHAVGCAVSPDGSTVSFGTNHGKYGERQIWLMGPNAEQPRKYYEGKEGTGTDCWGWSPDGKHYLFVSRDESGSRGLSQPVEGGPPITILGDAELSKMNDIVLLHDGRVVFDLPEPTNGNVCNYWTMRLDLATGRRLEEPRRLTNWPNFCVFSGSVTNNDKRFAFLASSGFYTSYIADLETGGKRLSNTRRFTLEEGDSVRGWTADGKVLVAQNGGSWSLYKQSLDSDTPEPIISSVPGGALLLGATTPDGKWYLGRIWPKGESIEHPTIPLPIVRIPLAGGRPETILQLSRLGNVSCARPPSSTCVLAEQGEDGKQMIVSILDPIKGRTSELVRFDFEREFAALDVPLCVISPDGTRLAIARSLESPVEIRSLKGQLIHTIPYQSFGILTYLAWSADQKGFFVSRKGQKGDDLLYLDFQGSSTSLRHCLGGDTCAGLPSPDGRHLVTADTDQRNNMWMMENF